MKPKNQKEVNRSYLRFYAMWLLTTIMLLIPLVVFFSKTDCEECKRQTSSNKVKGVENVNYEQVAEALDSLITVVKNIDIEDRKKLHLRTIEEFGKDFEIESNKKLSDQLRDIGAEVFGLANLYEDKIIGIRNTERQKIEEISSLKDELRESKISLNNCRTSMQNN